MSEFRDTLKRHFEENNVNISNLAKESGLDRTVIQHMIGNRKDYRLPSYESFQTVLSHLRISPADRKYVEQIFTMERIGEYNYYAQNAVKRIIDTIADLHATNFSSVAPIYKDFSSSTYSNKILLKGAHAVNSVLQWVCMDELSQGENPSISFNIPFTHSFFKQMVLQLYWRSKGQLQIKHMITLLKNPRNEPKRNANLDFVADVLPFAFCIGQGYQPRYYYTGLDIRNESLLLMPYYLITQDRILFISDDFTSAILITDTAIVKEYALLFDSRYNECTRLIRHFSSPIEIYSAYGSCITEDGIEYSIEFQPCLFEFMTEDMIKRTGRCETPEDMILIQAFIDYQKEFAKINITNYFFIEGLETFVNTGRTSIFPEEYVHPFSLEDRLALLRALRASILAGGEARLINPSMMRTLEKVHVSIMNDTLQFYFGNRDGFHYCFINESSIVSAFRGYFENLSYENSILSKEDTLSIIEKYIKGMEDSATS